VRLIAEELNMSRERVRQIVKEGFGMRKISTKMVTFNLIFYAEQTCLIGSYW
jgi:DNA-directed RNA polymerase sigma subunit (sigma70/sigma32)